MRQLITEFLSESVEMLDRIANLEKPPMTIKEIEKKRGLMAAAKTVEEENKIKDSLQKMDQHYIRGRGDMEIWTPELLEEIDNCFVANFMKGGEPMDFLFVPCCPEYLNVYDKYAKKVDDFLLNHADSKVTHARHYFIYTTIWEMRGFKFPVPLGTRSVVECLDKMLSRRRKGLIEVSLIMNAIDVMWSVSVSFDVHD